MPDPVATIQQVPELFGGLKSASDFSEFIEAVRAGTLVEFVEQKGLTGAEIAELYDYLRTRVRFDGDGGPPSDVATGSFDALMGLLGAGKEATGGIADWISHGQFGEETSPESQDFSPEMVQQGMAALAGEAAARGTQINREDVPVNDYINQLASKSGLPPRALAAELMKRNPGFPTEGNLGAGFPVETGIGTHTWAVGDTPQTVEKELGLPPGALMEFWMKMGLDPDSFQYGEKVVVPLSAEQRQAEFRGEGTMPQVTGAPTAVPGGDGTSTDPAATGDYTDPSQLQSDIYAGLDPMTLLDMFLPENMAPDMRQSRLDKSGYYDRAATLLATMAGLDDPTANRTEYFKQFAGAPPDTDVLLDALKQIGSKSAGEYSLPESQYFENSDDIYRLVGDLLNQRMGGYLSERLTGGPAGIAQWVEKALAEARLGGNNEMDIIDILMQEGII